MALPQVADGGTASIMVSSCEYIEYVVANSRQSGWARLWQLLTVKTGIVSKHEHLPRTWVDPLVRPTQRKRDMRFGTSMFGACIGQDHLQQQSGN